MRCPSAKQSDREARWRVCGVFAQIGLSMYVWMLNSHVVSLYSSFICTLALPLRYLIRSDPLAHVPEEPPVRSSSLKEGHESSIDAREDTQLWCQAVSTGSHLHNHPLQLPWGSGCVHADPVWKRILNCATAVCNCITWVPTFWQMTCPEMCPLWPFIYRQCK